VPSLHGAFTRLVRAYARIGELRDNIYQLDALPEPTDTREPGLDLPPIRSVHIGAAVLNLGAALDTLVFDLALLDSGAVQRGTRFPVCADEAEFRARVAEWLAGVGPQHVAAIEALQPFHGCTWTRTLAALADSDRQRLLIAVQPSPEASSGFEAPDLRVLAFEGGLPVVSTLGDLAREVALVLDSFNPDFGDV
jgi:hypothetical protein